MAKVSTLTEHDALRLILDCRAIGRNLDSFLLLSELDKKELVPMFPTAFQKSITSYLGSSNKVDLLIRKR